MSDLRTWLAGLSVDELAWLELVAKTTLVLAAAWLLEAGLARANPRWRRLLWRTTAWGLVLVAVSFLLPPLVSWAILPAQVAETPEIHNAPVVAAAGDSIDRAPPINVPPKTVGNTRGFDFSPQSAWIRQSRSHPVQAERERLMPASEAAVRATTGVSSMSDTAQTAAPSRPKAQARRLAGLPAWMAAIWCAGALLILEQTMLGVRRLEGIRRRATTGPARVKEQTAAIADKLGCRRVPDVLVSDEVASPCVAGVRRPVILLPKAQCEPQHHVELPAILAHEIAHLRGHDVAWQLLLHAVAVLWWFHPLAWRIRTAHAAACDAVCDAVAASHVGDVAAYGRTLARLAIRVTPSRAATGMAMARTSSIRRRIEALQRRVFPFALSRGAAIGAVLAGLSMFLLLGVFALARAQAEPAEANQHQKPTAAADADFNGMAVEVTDDAGQPVVDAGLHLKGRVNGVTFDRRLKTDENGLAKLKLTANPKIQYMRMQCDKPGLVPVYYNWRGDNRSVELPKSVHLRMSPGQTVSGVVQDENGLPIEGAQVRVSMPITWPKLASWIFYGAELKTDAQGRWNWDSAPIELGDVSVRVTHPDYLNGFGRFNGRENLTVLKQGLTVKGHVTDSQGNPIADAQARAGYDRFGTDEPVRNTDADGRFTLVNCKPGRSLVTIQADGFAPQCRELTIGNQNDDVEFKLEPGHVMRIRVVDVHGAPIQGVYFCTDTWRGFRSLALRIRTDAEGRAEWRSAPPDIVLCDLFLEGYMSVRRTPVMAGDEETVITLPDELVISGKVTDAVTGKPIGKFGVREGMVFQNSERVYWSRDQATEFADGTYRFKFDEPKRAHLLEFVAEGYKPAQSRRFKSTDGKQTFNVQLEPGSGPGGVVLLPDGRPAVGADVGLATQEVRAYLTAGRFHRSANSAPVFKTDDKGHFTLTLRDERPFTLIVVHDAGFAEVTRAQFDKSNEIRLRPWGRIEGRVMLGRKPDVNRDVSFWPKREGGLANFVFSNSYTVKTDADGRFKLDRVIPGPGYISRVVVTEFIKSWQNTPCWQVPVDVPPDGTVSVLIGGIGRPVVGQVELDRQPDVPIDWTTNEPVTIHRQDKNDAPGNLGEPSSYFRCAANLDESGRFRIPDVPAGNYRLRLDVNNPPTPNACGAGDAIGRASLEFVVPPMTDNRSDEPLDLGTITAVLSDTLDPGEMAPAFVLEGLTGDTVRLSEARGKLVLVDFWATWCGPCLAEMPLLKEIHEQFGGNPRFAMIGLACGQSPDPARRYVEENSLNWTHAFAGARGGGIGGIARKYTVHALPGTFLIGPDGRVLARNVRGEKLKQAIAAGLDDEELFEAAKSLGPPVRFPVVRFKRQDDKSAPAELPAVLVLDDCDPGFKKDKPHHDGLRAYSAGGTQLWAIDDLNNCQTVGGANHVAVDHDQQRIYVAESVGKSVTALDFKGRKLWQAENVEADALVLDPKTGHLWLSGGSSLNQGETVVLDSEGNEVAAYPFRGIDLAYDPYNEVTWLAGYEILQLDRDGRVRFRLPVEGWCCASVAVDATDGSAWFGERKHPDVVDSHNRLWHVTADCRVIRKVELGDFSPFKIVRDPGNGELWVCGYPRAIRRYTAEGEATDTLPIEANGIALGHGDSSPWVTTEKELLKLGGDGQVLGRYPFDKPSMQRWLTAF